MTDEPRYPDPKHRCLPDYFQFRRSVANAYPPVPTQTGAVMAAMANELLRNEWRTPEEIRERQLRQLRSLVGHAAQHSPYYANRLKQAGVRAEEIKSVEDYARVPILGRTDLQDHHDAIAARKLPQGIKAAGEMSTSGSSGSPVKVRATSFSALVWWACNMRANVWADCHPEGCMASIRFLDKKKAAAAHQPKGAHMPHWGGPLSQFFKTGEAYAMHIALDLENQADMLERANPHYITSYPTNLVSLGRLLRQRGVTLDRLEHIQTVSELLTAERRAEIEDLFGAVVFDTYSCVEVGYVANDCPERHGYHVHEENVLVEVVDDDGRPVKPGEVGRVLLTGLCNYGFPLLRYDVGDYAVAGARERCECGRGLMRLERIIGRQRGQLLSTDGRTLFSSPLSVAFRDAGLVRQFQVIQHERTRLEVIIVPMDGFGPAQEEVIRSAVQDYLGQGVEVSFSLVEKIPRTPGGKFLDFICRAT
jgi:phenylacetate-CoA ligase